jgi:uncharacterized protein (DUF433 family)
MGYNTYSSYIVEEPMSSNVSAVISMRLPAESGQRLKRLARRHGWTPSDASARLVEEGLRRAEFAFIDFRDSAVGRQACMQGSSLAVWEVVLLLRSYNGDAKAVAAHLGWPRAKVLAAQNYAAVYSQEIEEALTENESADFAAIRRMLPQAEEFKASKPAGRARAESTAR